MKRILGFVAAVACVGAAWAARGAEKAPPAAAKPGETQVPVTITGGYETDGRDRGRPVVLIAAALKVPAEVFRETFGHVRPAPAGQEPDPEQVRRNKAALMEGLGKFGVTDERLNEVSNFYRYRRDRDQLWRHEAAEAVATVRDGKVVAVTVTRAGYGYSSEPAVAVRGMPGARLQAEVAYGTDLKANGRVERITVVAEGEDKRK